MATLYTVVVFTLSVVAVALFWKLFYGSFLAGISVGIMVGGTSGAVVVPIVERLRVSDYVKGMATLESVLTDVLVVVGFSVIVTFVSGKGEVNPGMRLLQAFGIGAGIGVVVGFLWLQALRFLSSTGLSFTITLGVLLLTYGVVEVLGGSGPFSALVLGLVLSNAKALRRILREDILGSINIYLDDFTRRVSEEVSFLVRTFFFLLLGLAVDPGVLSSPLVIMGILAVFTLLIVVRYPVAALLRLLLKEINDRDAKVLWVMMPRGLASAVVAFSLSSVFPSLGNVLVAYALGVIVLSVLFMTVGVFLFTGKEQETENHGTENAEST
jgi:cell volume regulation protein A